MNAKIGKSILAIALAVFVGELVLICAGAVQPQNAPSNTTTTATTIMPAPKTWVKDGITYFNAPISGESADSSNASAADLPDKTPQQYAVDNFWDELTRVDKTPIHMAPKPLLKRLSANAYGDGICDSLFSAIRDGYMTPDHKQVEAQCTAWQPGALYYVMGERGGYYAVNSLDRVAAFKPPLYASAFSLGAPNGDDAAVDNFLGIGAI